MRKKKPVSKKKLKFLLRLTGVLFAMYLSFGFFAGWGVVFSDLGNKGRVAGSMVSAVVKVFGPPEAPIVNANADCDAQNEPFIFLTWSVEDDAVSYDIIRDGEDLILGLLDNYYTDGSVVSGVQYEYSVKAVGPMGEAGSDLVSIMATDCSAENIPEISIVTIRGRNVSSYSGTPSTFVRRPSFAGATNIVNAESGNRGNINCKSARFQRMPR